MRITINGRQKHYLIALLAGPLIILFLTSGNDQLTLLEQAQQRGSLTLLTHNGASSYFSARKAGPATRPMIKKRV